MKDYIHVLNNVDTEATAILIMIEGQFQVFQRFSSSKLLLTTVKRHFVTLTYYENGSIIDIRDVRMQTYMHKY